MSSLITVTISNTGLGQEYKNTSGGRRKLKCHVAIHMFLIIYLRYLRECETLSILSLQTLLFQVIE